MFQEVIGRWRYIAVVLAMTTLCVCVPLAGSIQAQTDNAQALYDEPENENLAKPDPAKQHASTMDSALAQAQAKLAKMRGEMLFGALLPLTGDKSDLGKTAKSALMIAIEDIKKFLTDAGSKVTLRLLVEDTRSDPQTALDGIKRLASAGAHIVIGPCTDKAVDAVKPYADRNNIIVLSPSSTGPYLSQRGDNIFRLSPMDTYQAEALANLMLEQGKTVVVPIWEGDMYGDELVVHVKARFRERHGRVVPGVRYYPTRSEFGSYVDLLVQEIAKSPVRDKSKIAIYYAGSNDIAAIFNEAAKRPELNGYNWYGCDRTAFNEVLARNPSARDYAIKVNFVSPKYGEAEGDWYPAMESRIKNETGILPAAESIVSYDGLWVAFLSAVRAGGTGNVKTLKKALFPTSRQVYGVTGWMALNARGDRKSDWDFDFWRLGKENGSYFWEKFARYQFMPDIGKQLIINKPSS
ncbi:ABC transporter substrate-binding protein [Desulfovibrio inopinatus]|uniref:ABC transporter substrate-binding protein n=1 Tax=Desulfovibrio inopinatus TaxID=102109 RepID=UPI0003FCEBB7|nr:penicillin-binding protein activator [Desulfovibrio inopinatus]